MAIRLTLHPDPGTGHSWRLTLEIGDVEFSADVAERIARDCNWGDPEEISGSKATANKIAARVAKELELEPCPFLMDRWTK